MTAGGFAIIRLKFGSLSQEAVDNINLIVETCEKYWLTYPQTAYLLATTYHETGGTMKPIKEYGGDKYLSKYDTGRLAKALGNTPQADGATYYPNGKAVTLKDAPITEKQADEMLSFMLVKYENAVSRYVSVPLTQNQFDALVSFCYNVGQSNLLSSTLLKKLNNKYYKGVSNEFLKWNKSGGKVLQGLVNRRKDEREVFLK